MSSLVANNQPYNSLVASKVNSKREKSDLKYFFKKIKSHSILEDRLKNLSILSESAATSKKWCEYNSITQHQLNDTVVKTIDAILKGDKTIEDQNKAIEEFIKPIKDELTRQIHAYGLEILELKRNSSTRELS